MTNIMTEWNYTMQLPPRTVCGGNLGHAASALKHGGPDLCDVAASYVHGSVDLGHAAAAPMECGVDLGLAVVTPKYGGMDHLPQPHHIETNADQEGIRAKF